ncbi:hypothetical protein BDN72DRAFT_904398 [Pluteus cervinus]|uniref:Uncharacterized protein n=1 Tax=Pluteus cervinus TaxID=181527 RepID=A0ACD3A720_9AGAR|nr:hypothetical protein BDN72DRAFT_904398 [Pluteus cervinus]
MRNGRPPNDVEHDTKDKDHPTVLPLSSIEVEQNPELDLTGDPCVHILGPLSYPFEDVYYCTPQLGDEEAKSIVQLLTQFQLGTPHFPPTPPFSHQSISGEKLALSIFLCGFTLSISLLTSTNQSDEVPWSPSVANLVFRHTDRSSMGFGSGFRGLMRLSVLLPACWTLQWELREVVADADEGGLGEVEVSGEIFHLKLRRYPQN